MPFLFLIEISDLITSLLKEIMSTYCKFYLKGNCRYGSRCHFLHEYPGDEKYGGYGDYNRYHVDNRQHNTNVYNDESSENDFIQLVFAEMKTFEQSHVWPFTVIAPLKNYGNIPGFQDFSPEEIRYQYYVARSSGGMMDYVRSYNQLKENVSRETQVFRNQSEAAYSVLREMINEAERNANTDLNASAASSFSFSLSSLPDSAISNSNQQFGMQAASPTSFGNQQLNQNFGSLSADFGSPLANTGSSSINFGSVPANFGSPSSNFGVPTGSAASFSFNLNNLHQDHSGITYTYDSIYSIANELKPAYMEAFKGDTFKFGSVPPEPPPKELC